MLLSAFATTITHAQNLTGQLNLHDPSAVIKVDETYYLFHTANRIGAKTSTNRVQWNSAPQVFSSINQVPSWTSELVPNFNCSSNNNCNIWAPDIAYFNDQYHLYYSVSSFGSQTSAIGLLTNPTLNRSDPNYQWTDQGPAIRSAPGLTAFNAIDPALIETTDGSIWMSFGSYWSGIYLTRIDPSTGKPLTGRGAAPPQRIAWNSSIEAPYIYERDGYFYLFVNWGSCCSGLNSTYNIRVGRSTSIVGPYVDQDGVNMVGGGGTLLLGTEGRIIGPGHASIFTDQGVEWLGYHYYDGNTQNGTSRYHLRTLEWTEDGWPVVGPNFAPGDVNVDGLVDTVDFAIIKNNLFQSVGSRAAGDLNGDGIVDFADFRIWKDNYAKIVGAEAAAYFFVPEPNCLAWMLIVGPVVLCYRRSPRRH